MTPSTTFQWPLSPAGTVQPVKSLPLNRLMKPAGGSLSAAPATLRVSREARELSAKHFRNRVVVFMDDGSFLWWLQWMRVGRSAVQGVISLRRWPGGAVFVLVEADLLQGNRPEPDSIQYRRILRKTVIAFRHIDESWVLIRIDGQIHEVERLDWSAEARPNDHRAVDNDIAPEVIEAALVD